MRPSVGTWGVEGEAMVPHAEILAVPVRGTDDPPDGAVQMTWTDPTGFIRTVHLVQWWRLDRQGLAAGVPVAVDVQARQRRDLSCPPHHVSARLLVTGDPEDKARVLIGDPDRVGSWAYGVLFHGAVLTSTTLLVDQP